MTVEADNPVTSMQHGPDMREAMLMATAFRLGDTVRLKSGGPVMTIVARARGNLGWQTFWFAGDELKDETFPAQALEPADPGPSHLAANSLEGTPQLAVDAVRRAIARIDGAPF